MLRTTLDSYTSYLSSGRKLDEVAWMVARDFMLLSQPKQQQGGNPSTSTTPLSLGGSGASSAISSFLGLPNAVSQTQSFAGSLGLGTMSGQGHSTASLVLSAQQLPSSLYPTHPYQFCSLPQSNLPSQQNK